MWWRAHRGQYRVAGDAVGDIAICEGAVVTATLTRSDFERLSIGTPATFTLRRSESGSERLHGRVVALVGSTVENSRRMALAYGRSALANGYGAIVRLSDRSQLSCRIGISGRLELMTRSGGWLDPRGWVHALGGMFDSDGQEAARWTGEEANRGVARGSLQLDLPPRSG